MTEIQFPFYAKSTIILFGIILLVITLNFCCDILAPFAFATLFAILLNPINHFLQRHKVPRLLAIMLTVLCGAVIIAGLLYLIITQMGEFMDALPQLREKLAGTLTNLQRWLSQSYGISVHKQVTWLNKLGENAGTVVGNTISTVTGLLVLVTLVPVYVFLILLYQNLLVNFIIRVFSNNDSTHIGEIMHESKVVIQSYIVGLLIETLIVAVLNSAGLLLLDIDYAILLGVVGALLNLIPYLGGLIAIALPVVIALITKDEVGPAFSIIGVYIIIQFIDNNILVPRIVASKVKINALISILAVLIGGAIGGLAGMFLSIPVIAILKIVFDRVESLKPWGMLLGDEIPVKRLRIPIKSTKTRKSISTEVVANVQV